jgi:mono/diheme cytochrome c family protein
MKLSLAFTITLLTLLLFGFAQPSAAKPLSQDDDLVARGQYLVNIAGCDGCHTPFRAEFANPELTPQQLQTLSMYERSTKDPELYLAGGRVFDLGPAGIIVATNITPDPETGIGNWTDEQIETAMRTGATPDGRQLIPIMPYTAYNQMSDADMEAIIAYLRTIPPIENDVLANRTANTEELSPIPAPDGPITAPDENAQTAYGEYLVRHVMACSDCHTPIDPDTGQPMMDRFLSGGQPFEGPWGIVYSANLTPDEETGLGAWTETEIKRAFLSGVRIDGRRLVLMPWEYYASLSATDADAAASYLKNGLTAVHQEVPTLAVAEELLQYSAIIPTATEEYNVENESNTSPNIVPLIGIVGLVLLIIGIAVYVLRRRAV